MDIQYNIVTWMEDAPVPAIDEWPESWQQRLNHHKVPVKRREATFAYGLLYQMVRNRLGYAPEMAVTATGKPYFLGERLHVSISHTKGAAMAAVAEVSVGVDIEQIRPVSTHFMNRFADTDDINLFFQTWVQREAVGKCLGTGITMTGQVPAVADGVFATQLQAPQGYVAAMAQRK